jgi:hypothetical protein
MKMYLINIIGILIISFPTYGQNFYSNKLINNLEEKTKEFKLLNDSAQIEHLNGIYTALSCINEDDAAEKISAFVIILYFESSDKVKSNFLGILRCYLFTQDKVRIRPENFLIKRFPIISLNDKDKLVCLDLFDELCLCGKLLEYEQPIMEEYCSEEALRYRESLLDVSR